jgi:hypothetical protein
MPLILTFVVGWPGVGLCKGCVDMEGDVNCDNGFALREAWVKFGEKGKG